MFYEQSIDVLTSLLTSAGDSLRADCHLYYVASEETGVLGIIDATECTPTYGSGVDLFVSLQLAMKSSKNICF